VRATICILTFAIVVLPMRDLEGQSISPDSAFRAFHRATVEERWLDAGQFLDPTSVDMARWDIIKSAGKWGRARTVEEYLRDDPKMPREVAEYFVRSAEESMRRMKNIIPYQFAFVEDTATLKQLSQLEAAARYVQARDFRYRIRMSYLSTPGCEGQTLDEAEAKELAPRFELLGTAVRGDTAWIMFRDTSRTGGYSFMGPGVATLFRVGTRWYVDIDRPQYGSAGFGIANVQCTDAAGAGTRRP
jgi:hypothetical protein